MLTKTKLSSNATGLYYSPVTFVRISTDLLAPLVTISSTGGGSYKLRIRNRRNTAATNRFSYLSNATNWRDTCHATVQIAKF